MMRPLLASRLRHTIAFQQKKTVVDADGFATETWVGVIGAYDVRAEVRAAPAGPGRDEFLQSAQKQSDMIYRVTTRWSMGLNYVNPAWRIIWDGKILNILAPAETDPTGRRWLLIKCRYSTQGDGS